MRALSNFLHATSDTATTLLNVVSISVATGAVTASITQQLRPGLIVSAATLLLICAGLGFRLWRSYRPRRTRHSFIVSRT